MEHKKLNRIVAITVFLITLAVYIKTIAPTVVFWDVGEFCASAFLLQIPHPPGAPLFLLLSRLSSMIPIIHDIAVRMHILSALGSAIACGLLYLITVDLIVMWRKIPTVLFDRFAVYGSAAIGTLSLAFTGTFWFNAVEAEVYGLTMTFVGLIILLGLRWYERADKDSGDRYILLIAYIVGLSVGVHLLAILALFPVMMLWYFRYYTFEWKSFLKFGIGAVLVFGIIYPGVVIVLPSLLDGEFRGTKSEFITLIPVALLLGACYGLYYSIQRKNRLFNVALLSFLLIVLGYSTYTMVYIRANAHPPMNENDPSTLSRLVSYLNREQYGSAPVFDRRWDSDPEKRRFHKNYSSDWDYLWRYQITHMYLRYLAWNYIGSENDLRDAGVNWKQYYMIPFLLGLLGAYYQWRQQPSMAFSMIVQFIIMGVILALYQNQQEPQPRERDYFYVGSFFVFSLWIAYGVLALIDLIKEKVAAEHIARPAGYGVLAFAFLLVPVKMFLTNYHQANRTGNYVAWDYSYNMLQSCEEDAILITNGDNDTFPLWYLQDVEGVRRDIRIVNLSLANTPWYIKQLKHETPYGAKKVPISSPDIEIENLQPIQFQPRWMELPVGQNVLQHYSLEGAQNRPLLDTSITNSGVLRFLMPNTLQFGEVKAIRAQDIMLYDIIRTTNWKRPVYFGMTVGDDSKIGLRDYLQLAGLTFKLVPWKTQDPWANVNEPTLHRNLFTDVKEFSTTPQYGFLWRGFQDSTTYYDEDTRRLLTSNYRNMFISYALYCAHVKNAPQELSAVLDRMEHVLPRCSIPMDYRFKFDLASLYTVADNNDRQRELMTEIIRELKPMIAKPVGEQLSQYNPFVVLYYCYDKMELYQEAEDLLPLIKAAYPAQPGIDQTLTDLRSQLQAKRQSASAAPQRQSQP